jgi:hypothetical protein
MSFYYPYTLTYNSIDKYQATFFQMGKIFLIVDISFFHSDLFLQAYLALQVIKQFAARFAAKIYL